MTAAPLRHAISSELEISRLVTGLWQVADIEKTGDLLDPDKAADHLETYFNAGFSTFDMADHYGSAELIAGRLLTRHQDARKPQICTKWCPEPGPMTPEIVRAGVQERLDRLGTDCIDLLQFHWWSFEHPAWLDALHEMTRLREEGLIKALGVTNFDAAHLRLALADGIPLATNQVSFSMVDRRALGQLSDLCASFNVSLLAYGTLCGGFLSDRWLGQPEPLDLTDWSKMKYKRFIDATGGGPDSRTFLRQLQKLQQNTKFHWQMSRHAGYWNRPRLQASSLVLALVRANTLPTMPNCFPSRWKQKTGNVSTKRSKPLTKFPAIVVMNTDGHHF